MALREGRLTVTEVICHARQFSDMMMCATCELQWDTNDEQPPVCPRNTTRRALASGWPLAETTVACPLCDDAATTRPGCLACNGAGRMAIARAARLRQPVRGKSFDPHWVVVSTWRWQKGYATDFKTRDGTPPFIHGTELSAMLECKRLSLKHPGKRFAVYASGFKAKIPVLGEAQTAAIESQAAALQSAPPTRQQEIDSGRS